MFSKVLFYPILKEAYVEIIIVVIQPSRPDVFAHGHVKIQQLEFPQYDEPWHEFKLVPREFSHLTVAMQKGSPW